jgi:squalene-associated FAD-dependent desaturase
MNAHVIGGGLAGLAAALSLTSAGHRVTIYESGPAAGGRCRSYFDRGLGCRIDNGNHLLLSGNTAAMDYLAQIGARHTMGGPGAAYFPFMDLVSGERWVVRPSAGRVPLWLMQRSRRVPGAGLGEYLSLMSLGRVGGDATVAETLDDGRALYRRLLEPLAVAALNTPPSAALARLLRPVVAETLMKGGRACIPVFPKEGLSESLIDPAIAWLESRGGTIRTSCRIAHLTTSGTRVTALETADGIVPIAPDDAIILAVPAWVAATLLPDLTVPDEYQAILNLHYRLDTATQGPVCKAGFLGLIGGTAEWLFLKPGIVSVTVSAANRLIDAPAETLAVHVWHDVAAALDLQSPMPPVRVVKERRATFAATAAQERRRPSPRTQFANLALAGDWTATGLPATIEGAIRSGRAAAALFAP